MKFKMLVSCLAVLTLTGCLVSENPLPDSQEATEDSPLIGYWLTPAENDSGETHEVMVIFSSETNPGLLRIMSNIGKVPELKDLDSIPAVTGTMSFDVILSRIGEKTFANLLSPPSDRGYIIVRYDFDGKNRLLVRHFSGAYSGRMTKKHPEWIGAEGYLNLSSDRLVKVLGDASDRDFAEPQIYTRWTDSVSKLKDFLEN